VQRYQVGDSPSGWRSLCSRCLRLCLALLREQTQKGCGGNCQKASYQEDVGRTDGVHQVAGAGEAQDTGDPVHGVEPGQAATEGLGGERIGGQSLGHGAVIDDLGLERFPLLGVSQGGPVAIAYAVRHPEKVSHLILYGTYARGRFHRDYSPQEAKTGQTLLSLIELGWGQDNPAFRQFFTTLFMPEAKAEQMHWFNDLQRVSTSPEIAVRLERAFFGIDVSELVPGVSVPTLVLHGRDDGIVPFEEGRQLAARIPGARFVALDSKNHILLESEPAWQRFLSEVHGFVSEEVRERSGLQLPPSIPVSR
jgi:fermentation-respiration switch protein FrsA (DUF1100 family)